MERLSHATREGLDQFFSLHDEKAYKMAYALTHNRDDALELVQDSMLKLVQHYAQKPPEEWTLLFYKILHNRINDFYRRQGLRKLFSVFIHDKDNNQDELLSRLADSTNNTPHQQVEQSLSLERILQALKTLPLRQQQTFLLRAWQEFSVRETAFALSISEGSVKTHYSRALKQLRFQLGENHE